MADARRDPGPKKDRSFANAAAKGDVFALRDEIEATGLDWHEAVKRAGLSRNLGYTLLRGEGSVGSLRQVQEWWLKESQQRKRDPLPPREEWAAIGLELEQLGHEELERTIEGLQEYIRAEKRRRAALRKMFRATPDADI